LQLVFHAVFNEGDELIDLLYGTFKMSDLLAFLFICLFIYLFIFHRPFIHCLVAIISFMHILDKIPP